MNDLIFKSLMSTLCSKRYTTYSDVRNPLVCGFNVKHSQHVKYNPQMFTTHIILKDKIRQYSPCDRRRWHGYLDFCRKTFNCLLTNQQYVTNLIFYALIRSIRFSIRWRSIRWYSLFLQQVMPKDQHEKLALMFFIHF